MERKGHQLASLVEQAKIQLSTAATATVDLESLFVDSTDISIENCELTQAQLDDAIQHDIDKIFKTLDETLKQAGISPHNVDTVFTTGGSTALNMVKACIGNAFPAARVVTGDLYNSVGSGLLMEATLRYR